MTTSDSQASIFTPAYRTYILLFLTLIYVTNFADRMLLSILLPYIREDPRFAITYFEAGLLSGTAFAIFYATLGIPIAMWADRGSRKLILTLSVTIWSVMTAVCGFAANTIQLLAARVGVGVGEAGGGPPSQSIISDLYPVEKRATAMAFFSLGVPIGIMLASFGGGAIAERYGWPYAFFMLGVPGLILALLFYITVREPPRGMSNPAGAPAMGAAPPLLQVWKFMWSQRAMRHLIVGATVVTFTGYSFVSLLPLFLVKSVGMPTSEVSTYVGLMLGIAGGLGTFGGGVIAQKLANRDIRWMSWTIGLMVGLGVICGLPVYLSYERAVILTAIAVPAFLGSAYIGVTFAMAQGLVGVKMRAVTAAVVLFIINLIGYGAGPAFTGWLADLLEPSYGQHALKIALLAVGLLNLWSAYHYWRCGHYLKDDMARAARS